MGDNSHDISATWKGLPLEGRFSYESRGGHYYESKWMRPRIAFRLWVKTKVTDRYGMLESVMLSYEGKELSRRWRCTLIGGETLEIVYGKERMMVYNRLMPATLNCMGKIQ
jgi:hypothetical protein